MPDIARVLKEEMQRLARKEIKAAITRLRKDNAVLKRTAADHKRRLARLEQNNRRLLASSEKERKHAIPATNEEVQTARVTAKMVRGIRAKLGVSQAELATLLGVNPQTVYQWEHKAGRLTFRGNAKASIVEVRKLKAGEAKDRLEKILQSRSKKTRGRKRRE